MEIALSVRERKQLAEQVAFRIIDFLKLQQEQPVIPERKLLTEKEIGEKYGKSHLWFWRKRKENQLPYIQIGRTIMYDENQIIEFMSHK